EYWQFWRNTEDADVGRFLRLFTELSIEEIERLEALEGAEINTAKIALANAATTMLHGEAAAKESEAAAAAAFTGAGSLEGLPIAESPYEEPPASIDLPKGDFQRARSTVALLKASGLASSNKEARRKISEGGVRINDEKIEAERWHTYDELLPEVGAFKVQLGKRVVLVKPV
ncbi:MAG: tyrosine--tRNA ligase, partial [Hyphomonas sp.]|nr:tyrosine--tRNA ligase [Hyphomonas sp.]